MPQSFIERDSDAIRREVEKLVKPLLEEQLKLLKKELESAILDGLRQELGSAISSSSSHVDSPRFGSSTRLANGIASIIEELLTPTRTTISSRESAQSSQINEAFRESRGQAQAKIQQEGARGSRNL